MGAYIEKIYYAMPLPNAGGVLMYAKKNVIWMALYYEIPCRLYKCDPCFSENIS